MKKYKTIGMVVALSAEYGHLYEKLGRLIGEYSFGNIKVTEFDHNGLRLYLADSGIGEISAALATQLLIVKYGAEIILNFGMVGSLSDKYKCKDVVLVKEVVHYDFSLRMSDAESFGKYIFSRDSYLLEANRDLLDFAESKIGAFSRARLMSGDKFVDVNAHKKWLKEHFGGEICDMESAGIHLACMNFDVPYLMIKTVSDNADEDATEDCDAMAEVGVHSYVDAVITLLDEWAS